MGVSRREPLYQTTARPHELYCNEVSSRIIADLRDERDQLNEAILARMHLRIKAFYGHSENAVKTQIWIAVASYVLIAILKKRLGLEASLHEILQVLSLNLFEKTPILQACGEMISQEKLEPISKQMNLLDL